MKMLRRAQQYGVSKAFFPQNLIELNPPLIAASQQTSDWFSKGGGTSPPKSRNFLLSNLETFKNLNILQVPGKRAFLVLAFRLNNYFTPDRKGISNNKNFKYQNSGYNGLFL